MKLTILGKSPSWADAGGACSGYLVEAGDLRLLLDCGNGVFGKLREHLDYLRLDAIILSHLHADHWLDLIPYAYALTYSPRQQPVPVHRWEGTDDPHRPRLIGPKGASDVFRRVVGAWGNEDLIYRAFAIEEYGPQDKIRVGPLEATFHPVPHFIATHAIALTADDGARLVYGADCRPCDEIVEAGRDADLLIIEGTLPRPERTGIRGHMTPEEAGEHAARAGAKRAVVTHISDELGDDWALEQARSGFGGDGIEIAREGATYEV